MGVCEYGLNLIKEKFCHKFLYGSLLSYKCLNLSDSDIFIRLALKGAEFLCQVK